VIDNPDDGIRHHPATTDVNQLMTRDTSSPSWASLGPTRGRQRLRQRAAGCTGCVDLHRLLSRRVGGDVVWMGCASRCHARASPRDGARCSGRSPCWATGVLALTALLGVPTRPRLLTRAQNELVHGGNGSANVTCPRSPSRCRTGMRRGLWVGTATAVRGGDSRGPPPRSAVSARRRPRPRLAPPPDGRCGRRRCTRGSGCAPGRAGGRGSA